MVEQRTYSITELAKLAGVSDDTIRRRISEIPELEYWQPRRKILIPESQAELILNRVKRFARKKSKK